MQKLGRTGAILGFLGPQSLGLGWVWVMRFRPRPRLGWVLGRDLRPKLGRAEVYSLPYNSIQFTMEYPELPIEEVPRTPSPPPEPPDSDTESFTADTTNSAASAMPCEPFPMGNLDRKLQRWNWLERDTAIQVLTLDSIDWSKQRIADYLGITRN